MSEALAIGSDENASDAWLHEAMLADDAYDMRELWAVLAGAKDAQKSADLEISATVTLKRRQHAVASSG